MAGLVPAIHVFVALQGRTDVDARAGKFYAACASLAASAGMTAELVTQSANAASGLRVPQQDAAVDLADLVGPGTEPAGDHLATPRIHSAVDAIEIVSGGFPAAAGCCGRRRHADRRNAAGRSFQPSDRTDVLMSMQNHLRAGLGHGVAKCRGVEQPLAVTARLAF